MEEVTSLGDYVKMSDDQNHHLNSQLNIRLTKWRTLLSQN